MTNIDNSRQDARKPVIWKATLTTNDDKVFDCEVRDVSLAGTHVTCLAPLAIKDEVLLTIDGLGDFAGEVCWVRNENIGLTLLVGPDLLLKKFDERNPNKSGSNDPLLPNE
jgi:hypothetical protein